MQEFWSDGFGGGRPHRLGYRRLQVEDVFEGRRLGVLFWIFSIWYPHGDTQQPVTYIESGGQWKGLGWRYKIEVAGIEMASKNHLKVRGDGKEAKSQA